MFLCQQNNRFGKLDRIWPKLCLKVVFWPFQFRFGDEKEAIIAGLQVLLSIETPIRVQEALWFTVRVFWKI